MSAIPVFVAVGDSITWSTERHFWKACDIGNRYGRTDYARYEMSKSYKGGLWMNLAFPSQQITHLETQAPLVDAILANGGSSRRYILVVMIGTNLTSADPQVQAGLIGDYCADRVAAGWEVMICTVLSRTDSGTWDSTYGEPLNAILRGDTTLTAFPGQYFMAHYGVDYICDYGAMKLLYPNGTNADNTLYFSDTIHPTSFGAQVMASKLQGAINEIAPFTNYSPKVEQFLDRLATPPSASMIALYETFINGLCLAGLWNAFVGLWVFPVETEADALINLVDSGAVLSKIVDSGTLVHTAYDGWLSSGAGGCLASDYNPSVAPSPAIVGQDELMVGCWNKDSSELSAFDVRGRTGFLTFANNVALYARWSGNWFEGQVNVNNLVTQSGNTNGSGYYAAQRSAASYHSIWKNGVEMQNEAVASTTPENCVISNYPMRGSRAFFIGRSLSASEHSTFYTLLGNFITGAVALGIAIMQTPPTLEGWEPYEVPIGIELTCNPGTWLPTPASYEHQWLRDGSPIDGETAQSYTTQAEDVYTLIKCEVVAVTPSGNSIPALSDEKTVYPPI